MFELRIRGATEKAREGNYGHGDEGEGGGGEGRGEGLFSIPPSARDGGTEEGQSKEGREGALVCSPAEQATRKIGHTGEGETANGSDIANDLPPAPAALAVALFVRKSVMLVGQSSQ